MVVHPEDYQGEDGIFGLSLWVTNFFCNRHLHNFLCHICMSHESESPIITAVIRVAEVAREHGWHPPKSLDSDKNFKPEHTLFCRELRFVAIYALFWRSLGIKSAFLGKNSASWTRSALLHGLYCIFYWVKFENLRLRAKTTHLSRKL